MKELGRNLGDFCPICTTGQLRPVLELPPPHEGRRLPEHRVAQLRIERLACHECGVSVESVDRGKTLNETHARQTYGFQNPDPMPEACRHGHGTLEVNGFVPQEVLDSLGIKPNVSNMVADPTHTRTYGFCPVCKVLHWVRFEQKPAKG